MTRREAARRPRATHRLTREECAELRGERHRVGSWRGLARAWPEFSARTLERAATGVRVTRLVAFVIRGRLRAEDRAE